ncbi:hypothetical protein DVH24_013948 [Malus domestica]|uniref:Uncharacterized protein n=1 Tax=Malus domestica TaxID=3750 RepID=A0A498JI56_MALDO|nr:hypothetical protein DVH24_013948 [Malus domestica]
MGISKIAYFLEFLGLEAQKAMPLVFQMVILNFLQSLNSTARTYRLATIIGQDKFSSGAIKSATDFQVYKEVAGLSPLDFGYTDNTAVTIQRFFSFPFAPFLGY